MSRQSLHDNVEYGALVDIISNVAGMMILLACISLKLNLDPPDQQKPPERVKPISFPMAYLPAKKRSVTLCMKEGYLYSLPDDELLQSMSVKATSGQPLTSLTLEKDGVHAEIELTHTATGYRFKFNLLPQGGVPLDDARAVKLKLDSVMKQFPPDQFFIVFHTWPTDFEKFRDIREYIHESGMEVGWFPRDPDFDGDVDVSYSIGEYSEGLSSIKAQ